MSSRRREGGGNGGGGGHSGGGRDGKILKELVDILSTKSTRPEETARLQKELQRLQADLKKRQAENRQLRERANALGITLKATIARDKARKAREDERAAAADTSSRTTRPERDPLRKLLVTGLFQLGARDRQAQAESEDPDAVDALSQLRKVAPGDVTSLHAAQQHLSGMLCLASNSLYSFPSTLVDALGLFHSLSDVSYPDRRNQAANRTWKSHESSLPHAKVSCDHQAVCVCVCVCVCVFLCVCVCARARA